MYLNTYRQTYLFHHLHAMYCYCGHLICTYATLLHLHIYSICSDPVWIWTYPVHLYMGWFPLSVPAPLPHSPLLTLCGRPLTRPVKWDAQRAAGAGELQWKLGKDASKVSNCQVAGLQVSTAIHSRAVRPNLRSIRPGRWGFGVLGFCWTKLGGWLAEWFRCLRGSCPRRESPLMSALSRDQSTLHSVSTH